MESDIKFIKYESGNPNFRGKTTIEIQEDRSIHVSFDQNNQTDRYSGRINDTAQKQLFEKIEAVDPCSYRSKKEIAEPGDIEVCFLIKYSEKTCKVKFWGSERFEDENLNDLINILNELASETSDGVITY